MAKPRVTYKPNRSFFLRPIPDEKRAVGVRQGSLLRTIARRSIRKRKAVSKPGSPPTNRKGQVKKFLFYAWDKASQSVVSGPQALSGRAEAPGLLERGGTRSTKKGSAKYAARPFMRPALEAAKAKLPELWKGAIKR